jgi:hypothetical protein
MNSALASIPKRLIQTGKTRDLPLLARAATANIRLLNPDFEYLFFDDNDVERFVDAEFPHYRKLFDAFPVRIQKYDFFRYLAVYRLGGFYFDLDIFLAKGVDDLRSLHCVFPFEELSLHRYLRRSHGMDWEVGNYAFGAVAGHPFIGAVIDNCARAQRDPTWAQVMWSAIPRLFREEFLVLDTTGPGLVSRTLAEFPDPAGCMTVLFPHDVCDPSMWHRFGEHGVHLQQGEWRDRKSVWQRRMRSAWETHERARGLEESRRKGPRRSLPAASTPSTPWRAALAPIGSR